MQKPDLHYWLAAAHLPGIGPVLFRRYLKSFQHIAELFAATSDKLQAIGLNNKQIKTIQQPDWQAVARDLRWAEQAHCHLLTVADAAFPTLLREIHDAPLVLYVEGNVDLLQLPQIALVGSRNPSPAGQDNAEQFSYSLAKAGFIITSGLALGIDAAAHRGALRATGKTLAVLGSGLSHIYPAAHQGLADEIKTTGALISEFSPTTLPKTSHFPQRNRIISGLSFGVVVVEAALRSGSLITARFANEQGREVFAIPGSIHNPLARGCHFLLRQGAKLVETAEDIVEELRAFIDLFQQTAKQDKKETAIPPVDQGQESHQAVLATLGYEVTSLDTIILRSGLTAGKVSSMLLSLELQGRVKSVLGGYIPA